MINKFKFYYNKKFECMVVEHQKGGVVVKYFTQNIICKVDSGTQWFKEGHPRVAVVGIFTNLVIEEDNAFISKMITLE